MNGDDMARVRGIPGPAPLFLLSSLVAREGMKVVVTGEGADELFAGYIDYGVHTKFKPIKVVTRWLTHLPAGARKLFPGEGESRGAAGSEREQRSLRSARFRRTTQYQWPMAQIRWGTDRRNGRGGSPGRHPANLGRANSGSRHARGQA